MFARDPINLKCDVYKLDHFYWELRVTTRKGKGFMCSTVLTQFVYLLKMAINFFSLDKTQNPLSEDFDKTNYSSD